MRGLKIVSMALLVFTNSVLNAEESSNSGVETKSSTTNNTADITEAVDTSDLINILINEGILDKNKLEQLVKEAKQDKSSQYGAAIDTVSDKNLDKNNSTGYEAGTVRVPYIPSYIKDEIRDQVRMELHDEVVAEVMSQAKNEAWGVPGTNPSWTKRIKISGDVRVRGETGQFAEKNSYTNALGQPILYPNYNAINAAGGTVAAGEDAFFNTTEDINRMRIRARLNFKTAITPGIEAGMRIVTGNIDNPVSSNATMGNYGSNFEIGLDRAYIKYNNFIDTLEIVGGRFSNPFLSSELVWDRDYSFEGVAASYWYLRSDDWEEEDMLIDPFLTVGVFPVQELSRVNDDKWMLGAQIGFELTPINQNVLKLGLAYYNYFNIEGTRNPLNSTEYDYTAPDYFQKGNIVFDINNDTDPNTELYALASDYDLINLTLIYDIARFAPHHVILGFDYVKNVGFDVDEIAERAEVPTSAVMKRTEGYSAILKYGWPEISKKRDWQVAFTYKYLERDAVLDAFTDSDFHGGGTDGKGSIFHFRYGLYDNTRMVFTWFSSDEIDRGPLGVDRFFLDIITEF